MPDAVAVVHGQRVQDLFPAVDPSDEIRAVLPPLCPDKVEDLQRGLLVGEVPAVTDRPAEPRVEALDRVRCCQEAPRGSKGLAITVERYPSHGGIKEEDDNG